MLQLNSRFLLPRLFLTCDKLDTSLGLRPRLGERTVKCITSSPNTSVLRQGGIGSFNLFNVEKSLPVLERTSLTTNFPTGP